MELFCMFLKAFIVGGLICVIGQILMQTTKLTSARILVLFVVAGVFLGALGVYNPIVDFAGAGATVPRQGSCTAGFRRCLRRRRRRGVSSIRASASRWCSCGPAAI